MTDDTITLWHNAHWTVICKGGPWEKLIHISLKMKMKTHWTKFLLVISNLHQTETLCYPHIAWICVCHRTRIAPEFPFTINVSGRVKGTTSMIPVAPKDLTIGLWRTSFIANKVYDFKYVEGVLSTALRIDRNDRTWWVPLKCSYPMTFELDASVATLEVSLVLFLQIHHCLASHD